MKKKLLRKPAIYKITNIITNKVYVGSSIDVKARKKEHYVGLRGKRHGNRYLQHAWNKYGEENFEFEVIEYVEDKTNLLKREQFWIDELDVCNENKGYNILPKAGSSLGAKRSEEARKNIKYSQKSKKIIQIDFEGNIVKEWFSLREIERKFGFSRVSISNCCKSNTKTSYNYIWIYKENLENFSLSTYTLNGKEIVFSTSNLPVDSKYGQKTIVQFTKENIFIKEWSSIKEASIELGIHRTTISQCCTGKKKSAGGFIWRYKIYIPEKVVL